MAQTLKDWVNTHVMKMGKLNDRDIFREKFFRNPHRILPNNSHLFYSSADGVIINQVEVNNIDSQLMEIKGRKYSLKEALGGKPELLEKIEKAGGALVIDVFMTYYDVHYNRMPTDGFLTYERLSQIESYNNSPMLDVEENLFRGRFKDSLKNLDYMFSNERVLNTIYSPKHNLEYYVIEIADDMINAIMPMYVPPQHSSNKHYYMQGKEFALIQKGSQNSIIIPFSKTYEYKTLLEPGYHVKAAEDVLFEFVKRD